MIFNNSTEKTDCPPFWPRKGVKSVKKYKTHEYFIYLCIDNGLYRISTRFSWDVKSCAMDNKDN